MPDWSYLPARPVAVRVLGEPRTHRVAATGIDLLTRTSAGRVLTGALAGTRDRPTAARVVAGVRCPGPVAVRVGVGAADTALRVLPSLGAGLVEIGPVGPRDAGAVLEALRRRPPTVPVALRLTADVPPGTRDRLAAQADLLTREDLGVVRAHPAGGGREVATLVPFGELRQAVAQLRSGAGPVLLSTADLFAHGPGLINRITEAVSDRDHPEPATVRSCGRDPRRWPGWLWAALLALGLVCGGLGAAVIAVGPVLLWYDLDYLGAGVAELDAIDPQVLDFILHDRISMGGAMVALGVLYLGLAHGMRLGWEWSREALLVSGVVGFPTLAFFLAHGFIDPLHVGLTAVLLPPFVLAVRRPCAPRWRVREDGPEQERHRAHTGQLVLLAVGVGVGIGGAVISVVGLTQVFVPSDLAFIGTSQESLHAANHRLVGFLAHDRAGFGGILMSSGVALTWAAAHGWRRGARWVWWTLAVAGLCGWVPTLVVHHAVGYVDAAHLFPAVLGLVLTVVGLVLAGPYLLAVGPGAASASASASASGQRGSGG